MHEIRDRNILPQAALTVASDTAWRGAHRAQLIKRGIVVFTPHHDGLELPVVDVESRFSGTSCRIYHVVEIPCVQQTLVLRVPVYETKADQKIDPRTRRMTFNRTEYLRIIPPETDAGRRLLGFRQDSESGNSNLDLAFRLERMPAYGAAGALLAFIGFAWVANSIALTWGRHDG